MRRVPTATGQDGAALRADEVRPAGGVAALASGERVSLAGILHSNDQEVIGVSLVAFGAVEDGAQSLGSAALVEHPRPLLERRAVADVDAMSTIEERDPIAAVVTIEADYRPVHLLSVCRPRRRRAGWFLSGA